MHGQCFLRVHRHPVPGPPSIRIAPTLGGAPLAGHTSIPALAAANVMNSTIVTPRTFRRQLRTKAHLASLWPLTMSATFPPGIKVITSLAAEPKRLYPVMYKHHFAYPGAGDDETGDLKHKASGRWAEAVHRHRRPGGECPGRGRPGGVTAGILDADPTSCSAAGYPRAQRSPPSPGRPRR